MKMTTRGTAESYRAFTRTWWARNPVWPGGKEPCPGRKTTIGRHLTLAEARAICEQYNLTHNPGPLSRKAEFERE
jgi:hypothetical protein